MTHQGQLTGCVGLSKRILVHTVLVNKWRLLNKLQEDSPALNLWSWCSGVLRRWRGDGRISSGLPTKKDIVTSPTLSDRKLTSNVEEAAPSQVRKMPLSPGKTARTRK